MLTQAAGLARCRVRAVDLVGLLAFCIFCPMRFELRVKAVPGGSHAGVRCSHRNCSKFSVDDLLLGISL